VLPAAKSGLVTGVLLAVSRIAGETAPLIIVLGGSRFFFQGLNRPMAALPLEIWKDALQPFPEVQAQGWGAALILILMVLSINIAVRLASRSRMKT
jgi:phosphate transport system permease protein